ncbi:MAG TPA: PAS domain S-box protein [Thiotrichaceae bacterium]|nr:PAS domain S-box protein [Thiotrichaceae bacterium]
MTLRQKTLWLVGGALVGLLVLLLSVSSTILLKGFTDLEAEGVQKNVTRLSKLLSQELENLSVEASDYAAWDDTYAYMKTRDQAYITSNFVETTFESLNLRFLALLDSDADMVFGLAYDANLGQLEPLDTHLQNHLGSEGLVKRGDKLRGLLLLPDEVMWVASYPILTSEEAGPSRGTLIMGRPLDDAAVRRLSELSFLSVSFQRLDNQVLPDDFAKAYPAFERQETVVQILSSDRIAGYLLVNDIYDEPALLLRVRMPREIYQQGLTGLRYISGFVLGFALIFAGLIPWLFDRLVLRRLASLSYEVRLLDTTDELSTVTVRENDELAELARAINNKLKALQTFYAKVSENEARLAKAQRIACVGNWCWDIVNPHFDCSDEGYRILGFQPQSLISDYAFFLNCVHPADRERVSNAIQKAMREGESYSLEHRIVQESGKIRSIQALGETVRDNSGQIVQIFCVLQDITEHKLAQEKTLSLLEENQRAQTEMLLLLEENQKTQVETLRLLDDNRFLISRYMAIQEDERRLLARELHDEFGQYLTAIQADAEAIVELAQQDIGINHLKNIVLSGEAILSVSSHVYDVVHTLMRQLRPSGLDELGLVETLRDYLATWEVRHQTPCHFIAKGDLHHLGETINIHLYRVVQESLTNIAKYAQASHVSIRLHNDKVSERLTLCVQDDGCGLNQNQHKRGLGLIGMRERAQALDGKWQLDSTPGKGVKITFTIPIGETYLQKQSKWT